MWKKKTLALLTAVAMAGSAIQPVMAQGNYDRGYDNGYPNNGDRGYDNGYSNNRYGDRGYDNGPPPSNNGDYDRYERDRDQYERDRDRYEADRAAGTRWDRTAYYQECERQRQGNTAGGAIVGALAGGLLGNAISRGPQRGAGTAVGAIFGGLLGAGIGSNLDCQQRSYAIDANYRGFEAGRPHARYDWRDPRGDAYGYVQVGDYYQDRGRRCTTYTQEIWVHGRPETARGRACRQPDGTWQMIS
jgi:surface antigen